MLVLEEGSAECNGVIGPCVCATTKASADTVDTYACCDLGLDDSTGSRYFCYDMLIVSKLELDGSGRRWWVESYSSNLREGEGGSGEGYWGSGAVGELLV